MEPNGIRRIQITGMRSADLAKIVPILKFDQDPDEENLDETRDDARNETCECKS